MLSVPHGFSFVNRNNSKGLIMLVYAETKKKKLEFCPVWECPWGWFFFLTEAIKMFGYHNYYVGSMSKWGKICASSVFALKNHWFNIVLVFFNYFDLLILKTNIKRIILMYFQVKILFEKQTILKRHLTILIVGSNFKNW